MYAPVSFPGIPKVHPNAYLAPLGALKKLDYDWNVVYVAIAHSDFKPQGRVPQSRFAPLAAHMRQDHHMGHFCHREYLREDFEWKDLEEAGKDTPKVRIVPGPEHEDYDFARDMEAYHKDQTLFTKQKNQKLTIENQQILARLEAAEKMKAEHIAFLNSMQQELASKSQVILEMQQHESQLEAQ
ncbi:hypothetical protein B0H14DRAFT_3676620 [Mycena olivaceomarginata]|nr:hypothetical protein B0H14DRAFT_3676620 [Mycena olivaceomarginata]